MRAEFGSFVRAQLRSFGFALHGIRALCASQRNARIQFALGLAAALLGAALRLERWEWVAVTVAIAAVLSCEALNTALELLCNRVSPEFDPLIGQAKDVGAAAVLIAAIGAAVLGALVSRSVIFHI